MSYHNAILEALTRTCPKCNGLAGTGDAACGHCHNLGLVPSDEGQRLIAVLSAGLQLQVSQQDGRLQALELGKANLNHGLQTLETRMTEAEQQIEW